MKKHWPKIKRVLIPVVAVMSLLVVGGVLYYVNDSQDEIACDKIKMNFVRKGEGNLVTEQEVRKLVDTHCNGSASGLSTAELEKAVEELESVKNAEVYRGINGDVSIEIEQRTPICRVHDLSGSQYYLDESGEPFPISKNYTARVPFVNGNLDEPYKSRRGKMNSDSLKKISRLDDLAVLFKNIRKDPFRQALVEQVWVAENGDFELVPKIDDHIIIFGDTTEMDGKFNKLKIFYEEGLNTKGWNSYRTVNLKYKNQIICKK